MSTRTSARRLALLAPTLAAGALGGAALLGPPPNVALLPWIAVASLASLHRPLGGGGLGLAHAPLAVLAARGEPFAAGLVALAASLLAGLLDSPLRWAAGVLRERRGLGRRLEGASAVCLAALVGALTWSTLARRSGAADPGADLGVGELVSALPWLPAFAAAILQATMAIVLQLLLVAPRRPVDWRRFLPALTVDAAGWAAGAVVVAAFAADRRLGTATLGLLVGLGLEAARVELGRLRLARRLGEVEMAQLAAARVLAEAGDLRAIVDRMRAECRVALSFHGFELTLDAGPTAPAIWSGWGNAALAAEGATPPPHPPPLPGIHRRPRWTVLERTLAGASGMRARLCLWCDPRQLDRRGADLLDALLPTLCASLERALLDYAARTDALTGLASRRLLDERLPAAFAAAASDGTSLAITLLDLDHFKQINDVHGHAAGDQALVAVAAALRAGAPAEALCCRFGGEELLVLTAGHDGAAALATAERLRRRVAALRVVPTGSAQPLALTVSAGVAAFPEVFARDAGELVELADAALYAAKRSGRNRSLLALDARRFRSPSGEQVGHGDSEAGGQAPVFFA